MNSGEVIGKGRGVNVSGLTLKDGTITSDEIGAYASSANIQGGSISAGAVALIGGCIAFLVGVLDGYTRPFRCR